MSASGLRAGLALVLLASLVACSDGAGLPAWRRADAQQEAIRPTFNVQAAFNYTVTDVTPLAFRIEGVANGVPYVGTGFYEQSMLETVAEFGSQGGALRKTTPVRMTLTMGGREVKAESLTQEFYTRHGLQLLGRVGNAPQQEYLEVTSYGGLPSQAAVGAGGVLYTADRYAYAALRVRTGRTEATYTQEPDGVAGSAVLTVRAEDKGLDGSTRGITTTVYRINQGGTARRVSETTADGSGNTTLTATFL
jgi:hypothetical protein